MQKKDRRCLSFFIEKNLRRKMEKDVFTADSKRYGGDAALCPK